MKYDTIVYHPKNGKQSNEDVESAKICPCCGISLRPSILYTVCIDADEQEDSFIYQLNHCENCNECFISKHSFDVESDSGYCFSNSAPIKSVDCTFSSDICSLSSDFVKIYKQAFQAESLGLDEICGMGYRKAIEFLIKDYIIHKDSSLKDSVITMPLMQCITSYIHDDRLITLARASAWLGNDETHYIKAHPDYNLNHLRIFINAFVTYVDADLAYESAQKLISR